MDKEKSNLLSPKLDVVFQALFGEVGNERITKRFLEAILERKIEEVNLSENIVLRRETESDKLGVLDVLAKIDGEEYCNIEMQMAIQENILERVLYYWARIYVKNMKKEKSIEIAKKMKEKGFDVDSIQELTGLSKNEIKKI